MEGMPSDFYRVVRIHEPLVCSLVFIDKLYLVREERVLLRDIDGEVAVLLKESIPGSQVKSFPVHHAPHMVSCVVTNLVNLHILQGRRC